MTVELREDSQIVYLLCETWREGKRWSIHHALDAKMLYKDYISPNFIIDHCLLDMMYQLKCDSKNICVSVVGDVYMKLKHPYPDPMITAIMEKGVESIANKED